MSITLNIRDKKDIIFDGYLYHNFTDSIVLNTVGI